MSFKLHIFHESWNFSSFLFLCFFGPLTNYEVLTLRSNYETNRLYAGLHLANSDYADYDQDYWVGPIPQDYALVKEKSVKRQEFEPARFNLVGKKNKKTKVLYKN